jgi:hypothetical protein
LRLWRNGQADFAGDGGGERGLHFEHVAEAAVVILGPHVGVLARVHELRGNADTLCRRAHAAFQDEVEVEFGGDLVGGLCAGFIRECGGARDHAQADGIEPGQTIDHLLGEAVGEIVLLRVAAQIGERQDEQAASALTLRGRAHDRAEARGPA